MLLLIIIIIVKWFSFGFCACLLLELCCTFSFTLFANAWTPFARCPIVRHDARFRPRACCFHARGPRWRYEYSTSTYILLIIHCWLHLHPPPPLLLLFIFLFFSVFRQGSWYFLLRFTLSAGTAIHILFGFQIFLCVFKFRALFIYFFFRTFQLELLSSSLLLCC